MSVPFDPAQHQASTVCLPPGNWATVLDCLCDHFKAISREQWLDRIARGRVLDARGAPIDLALAYKPGLRIHYFREVPNEKPIPVQEHVLHIDEHLVVADKPHFLPVTPAGRYLEHTLLRRLQRRLGEPRGRLPFGDEFLRSYSPLIPYLFLQNHLCATTPARTTASAIARVFNSRWQCDQSRQVWRWRVGVWKCHRRHKEVLESWLSRRFDLGHMRNGVLHFASLST